jgi:hypothetical protein
VKSPLTITKGTPGTCWRTVALVGIILLTRQAQAQPVRAQTPAQIQADIKAGFKGEYFLTRSEDPICPAFTKNLNQFRKLDFDECAPRLSQQYPEFSRPEWKDVPLNLEIAEKAFRDVSLEYTQSRSEMDRKWQSRLDETAELRKNGQVKMWMTEADINNDGTPDPIARVQYAHPASSLPVLQRGCVYSHSGLWKLSPNTEWLYNGQSHFYFGRDADIIYSNKTERFYSLEWGEGQVGPILDGDEIGATRGVLVDFAYGAPSSLNPVCYINWVPTGKYKPLQRKFTTPQHRK